MAKKSTPSKGREMKLFTGGRDNKGRGKQVKKNAKKMGRTGK